MQQVEIAVVGGGLTGASLAAALAREPRLRGPSVLVLEARAGRNPRFAGELIHPTGVDVLDGAGLLPAIHDGGVDVRGFAVVPGRATPATQDRPMLLPYAEIPGVRPAGFAMEHHDMVAQLRSSAAAQPGVTIRTGARVVDLVRDGDRVAGVRLEDGEEIRARLTLVAEGRHSRLRGLLGIEERARLVSYSAAVLVEDTALPHDGYGHIFLGAPGPILAYPIHGKGASTTVRMVIDLPTPLLEANKGAAAVAALLRRDYAPLVPEPLRAGMLRSLAGRAPEMAANQSISTRRCTAPGIALVGESGGCSHPLTAAGMTVCLTDIRILVEELAAAGPGRPAEWRALANYQERRYRFVRAREVLADALYEVFLGADDGARAIRNGIFRYWRSSLRARTASMALLAGADSRLGSFLGEYLRVVGLSLDGVARGQVNDRTLPGRARSLQGLVAKSLDKLAIVARYVRDGEMR